jgi:hypothetical protein
MDLNDGPVKRTAIRSAKYPKLLFQVAYIDSEFFFVVFFFSYFFECVALAFLGAFFLVAAMLENESERMMKLNISAICFVM